MPHMCEGSPFCGAGLLVQGGATQSVDVSSLFDASVLTVGSVQPASLSMVDRVGPPSPAGPVSVVPLNVTSYFVTLGAA